MPRWFTRPQTVAHASTNRAKCRLATLIETNALTATLRRHLYLYSCPHCTYKITRSSVTAYGILWNSRAVCWQWPFQI